MKYYETDANNIVIRVQPNYENGLKKDLNNSAICGMIDNLNGTFSIQSKTQAELQQEVFNHFDTLTRQFINDAVIAFDDVNKTTFRNIEAFTKYLYNVNDVRYPIAVSFLTWQSAVWDAVIVQRDAYIASGTAPIDADFLAALPAKI